MSNLADGLDYADPKSTLDSTMAEVKAMESQSSLNAMEAAGQSKKKAFLVTSYMTGSTWGRNLGMPGYSYDFLAKLFRPIIEEHGEYIAISDPKMELDEAAQQARCRGLEPVHLSFLPFQHIRLCNTAPNIVMPAWEFPDIPDHEFDNLPQNNWTKVANDCNLIMVAGDYTGDALRRGGVTTPVVSVQTPAAHAYFGLRPLVSRSRSCCSMPSILACES